MSNNREAGKGDKQRPTNYQSFSEQMKTIFGERKCPDCGKQLFEGHIHTCTPKQEKPE
jgi:hypothetical protein